MALMRWDPFTALARLDQEFDEVVRRTFGASAQQFVPPVEMSVEGSDVVITMEVAGVDVDEIDIEVANGRLTISGERRDRWEDNRGRLLVREMRYGTFRRTFQLPAGVRPEQIEASLDKGLLRIRIKDVARPVQAPQKISVHGAETAQQKSIEERKSEDEQAQIATGGGTEAQPVDARSTLTEGDQTGTGGTSYASGDQSSTTSDQSPSGSSDQSPTGSSDQSLGGETVPVRSGEQDQTAASSDPRYATTDSSSGSTTDTRRS
jgi:HSP20 family protein